MPASEDNLTPPPLSPANFLPTHANMNVKNGEQSFESAVKTYTTSVALSRMKGAECVQRASRHSNHASRCSAKWQRQFASLADSLLSMLNACRRPRLPVPCQRLLFLRQIRRSNHPKYVREYHRLKILVMSWWRHRLLQRTNLDLLFFFFFYFFLFALLCAGKRPSSSRIFLFGSFFPLPFTHTLPRISASVVSAGFGILLCFSSVFIIFRS